MLRDAVALTRDDIQRGWYPCPGCRSEVMIWPMPGDKGLFGEEVEPQENRDLCADCDGNGTYVPGGQA